MRKCVFEIGNSNLGTRKLATTCQPALAWRTLRLPRLLDLQCCLPPWEQFSRTVPPLRFACIIACIRVPTTAGASPCAHHGRSPRRPEVPTSSIPIAPRAFLGSTWVLFGFHLPSAWVVPDSTPGVYSARSCGLPRAQAGASFGSHL